MRLSWSMGHLGVERGVARVLLGSFQGSSGLGSIQWRLNVNP